MKIAFHKSLRTKIGGVVFASGSILIAIVFFIYLPLLEKSLRDERVQTLHAVVHSAVSVMEYYEKGIRESYWLKDNDFPSGRVQARQLILSYLRHLEFLEGQQIFILDMQGKAVLYPAEPSLEGNSVANNSLVKNEVSFPFEEILLAAIKDTNAVIEYPWVNQRDERLIETQWTYTEFFYPWGWVVCASINAEDIQQYVDEVSQQVIIKLGLALFAALVLAYYLVVKITSPMTRLSYQVQKITEYSSRGTLKQIDVHTNDEVGVLASAFRKTLQRLSNTLMMLRNKQESLQTTLNSIGDGVVSVDIEGRIQLFNPVAANLTGLEASQVKSAFIDDVITLYDLENGEVISMSQFIDVMQGEVGAISHEAILNSTTGQTHVVLVTMSSIISSDIDCQGAVFAISDITKKKEREQDLKDLNQELKSHKEELEYKVAERTNELSYTIENLKNTRNQLVSTEKMASLGRLVAGISHEINTPLGVCVTAVSCLEQNYIHFKTACLEGQLSKRYLNSYLEDTEEGLTLVLNNLTRASGLVQSFKQVSVDQSNNNYRDFDVLDYMQEIAASLKPHIKASGHRFMVDCPEALKMYANPGAISQVFTNLIMNSVLHGFEEREQGLMTLNIFEDGEDVIFDYKDDGVGMGNDVVEKIFEPFFTTKLGQGGSGLGMHIVYNLVTVTLEGSIECKSTLGEGTRFIIRLPHKGLPEDSI